MIRRLAVVAITLMLAGCAGTAAGTTPGTDTLEGDWTLVAGSDADGALTLDVTHPVTLAFGAERNGGTAACNSYGAEFGSDGITVGARTEMACEPATVMELESRYLAALDAVTSVTSTDDGLLLTGPDVSLEFENTPLAQSLPFVGTTWQLVTLTTDDTASTPIGLVTVTADGTRLAYSIECNGGSGDYTLDGDHLTGGPFVHTLIGCDEAYSEQDTALADLLADATIELPESLNVAQLVVTGANGSVGRFTAVP